MSETGATPRVTLRIPGEWSHPQELLERLPDGLRLKPDRLFLRDGTEFEFDAVPPDGEFASVFESACRQPPTEQELAAVRRYKVNIVLSGAGGSMDSALAIMRAGAAIVQAGGAGVFIDNSALAHGGENWTGMTEDGSPDAVSYAFASIVAGPHEVYTMGMQVMGFPNLLLRASDVDENGETVVEIIRYICGGDRPVDVGHIIADLQGPRIHVVSKVADEFKSTSVMHNPYGRLKLVSAQEFAEGN